MAQTNLEFSPRQSRRVDPQGIDAIERLDDGLLQSTAIVGSGREVNDDLIGVDFDDAERLRHLPEVVVVSEDVQKYLQERQVLRLLYPSHENAVHATLRPVKTVDQNLLDEVAKRLTNELHPEGIWLFGSHAWGTPDEGSDLDLFVVVPESEEAPIQRVRRAHRCLRGLGIAKDVLVKTRQEFDRLRALPSTLDYLVFHQGRKLYG